MSDLGKVVQKLSETNLRLAKLEEQNTESNTAASIIAQSLPEILNDRSIATGREKFDKREKITETDDNVRKNTEVLGEKLDKLQATEIQTADDIRYAAKTNSDLVMHLADSAIAGNADAISELSKLQKDDGGLVTEQLTQEKLDELLGVLKLANNKENKREGFKAIGESIKSALGKTGLFGMMKSIGGYFSGLAKSAGKGALNILKTLGLAAGLGLLITVLESDMLKKFLSVENIERFRLGIKRFVDSTKKVFDAYFGPEGGFFKAIRTLGEELGLIEKETDDANKKLIDELKNKGIAASVIAIGGSFLLLKKAFTSLRNMVTGQTTKTLKNAGVKTGGGKPGSVNKRGFLIDNKGRATTTNKSSPDFKKNRKQILKNESKLKGGAFKSIARKIPAIGMFFTIEDILNVLGNESLSTQEKTAGIAEVLFKLGGSIIGAAAGGTLGTAIGGPFGTFVGGLLGGTLGYIYSEETARGAAQYLLGEPITAFDYLKEAFKNRRKEVKQLDTGKNLTKSSQTIPGFTNVNGVLVKNKPKNFPIPKSRPKDLNFKVGDDAAASGERMIGGNPFLTAKMFGNSPVINNFNTITKGGDTTSEVKNLLSTRLVTPSLNQLFIYST